MNIQQSYRQALVQGASPVALVIRLYEQIIEDLRQISIAIERNEIERRTRRINHVILVIAHLQSSLDFSRGGKLAHDLNRFYNLLRQRLVQVQFHPSQRAVAQLTTDLMAVREAWTVVERTVVERTVVERGEVERAEVERTERPSSAIADRVVPSNPADSESNSAHLDWNG